MVPAGGPDCSTSLHAQNIWGKIGMFRWSTYDSPLGLDDIVQKCPYFPVLHRIFCAWPNLTPPAITTGVGPNGRHTVYLPPPCRRSYSPDIPIDPALTSQTPTFSQPFHDSPDSPWVDSPSLSQDLDLLPPPQSHDQLLSPPPSQYPIRKTRYVSQPSMAGGVSTVRGSSQRHKKPVISVDDFLASVSPKPRLKRNRGAEDVYEMVETVVRYSISPCYTTHSHAKIGLAITRSSRFRGVRRRHVKGS